MVASLLLGGETVLLLLKTEHDFCATEIFDAITCVRFYAGLDRVLCSDATSDTTPIQSTAKAKLDAA